ncbi:DUF3148 domain-containing protein [Nodosilinea sp. LEGE 07088]|uniref:regulatory protein SipA n=1 Tax=Nodosilinea sp. LEGE 07088 TaxID=2777968 RepID=UPI00188062B4|nr:DUF3148 domain-containing protein [Nodosilinea sp. LEGE 07088]MBE9139151.1 DUF3148 domain-containing protein [Nodosilinea sp. LEGE 07088]
MATDDFGVGDRVCLIALPPYFKTADTMPMLRPADTLSVGAEGIVMSRRPGGYWGIKFDKGSFLVDSQFLRPISAPADQTTEAAEP